MTIPNLITIGRLMLVPLTIWLIIYDKHVLAFWTFVAAGVSDAVDGFLARQFNMWSALGSYLDPIADKALIVSIYVSLGIAEAIPRWLVILVVSRDIMIVGAVLLSWLLGRPMAVKPLLVSKLNTVAQIVFACLVLAALGFRFDLGPVAVIGMATVTILTLLSIGFYLAEWIRHIGLAEPKR